MKDFHTFKQIKNIGILFNFYLQGHFNKIGLIYHDE